MKRKLFSVFLCALACLFTLLGCTPTAKPFHPDDLTLEQIEVKTLTWNVFLGKGKGENCMEIIEKHAPDVIHFQEAIGFYEGLVEPFLAAHLEFAVLNTQLAEENIVCSTPILYDTDKLEVLTYGVERLVDAYMGTTDNGSKTLSWVVFKLKANGKTYIDLNFHGAIALAKYENFVGFTAEQVSEAGRQWSLGNVRQIMAKVDFLQEEYGDLPVILTGDCNFDNTAPAYQLLMESEYFDSEVVGMYERTEDNIQTRHTLNSYDDVRIGPAIDKIFGFGEVYFLTHHIDRSEKTIEASDHYPVIATAYFNV